MRTLPLLRRATSVVVIGGVAAIMWVGTAAAQDATLKMRFVYDGFRPEVSNFTATHDLVYCGQHEIPNEKLIINPENKGIKNVIVHADGRSSGMDLPKRTHTPQTHVLATVECRFQPHIVLAQAGDKLKITNSDPIGHNANLSFIRNRRPSLMIPVGNDAVIVLEKAEPAPIPIECNIHPWMRAYVVVLDNPFADVSNDSGEIEINGLPAGKDIEFVVRFEGGRLDKVKVDGENTDWRRQRFDIDLKSGVNDMGDILVPANAVSAD